jgi:sodium/bile acid cotransporter 7
LNELRCAAGNEPAALVNAVLGNIIGIFITPLWLSHFLDVQGAAPYAAVLIELTYTIIGPLIVGQLMQYLTPKLVSQKVMSGGQPRPATTHIVFVV